MYEGKAENNLQCTDKEPQGHKGQITFLCREVSQGFTEKVMYEMILEGRVGIFTQGDVGEK